MLQAPDLLADTLDETIARFYVTVERIDKRGYADQIRIVIIGLTIRSDETGIVDIVEGAKDGDIEVGQVEQRRVFRRNTDGTAEYRIIRPDPVLKEQRK